MPALLMANANSAAAATITARGRAAAAGSTASTSAGCLSRASKTGVHATIHEVIRTACRV